MKFPQVGELRHWAELRVRKDFPVGSSSLSPEFPELLGQWAKVEPVGTAVYANSVQTDVRITHRIFVRWRRGLGRYNEVSCQGLLYRVLRVGDIKGKEHWAVLEVEELGDE